MIKASKPLGIVLSMIFFIIVAFMSLLNVFLKHTKSSYLFGVVIDFPLAVAIDIVLFGLTVFILFAVYKRIAWKTILTVYGLIILNNVTLLLRLLLSSPVQIYSLAIETAPQAFHGAVSQGKYIILIPLIIGVGIAIAIWIYLFKQKDYFMEGK